MISMRGERGITVVLAVDNEGGCALQLEQAILLRSKGRVDLGLWLLEEKAAQSGLTARPSDRQ